MINKIQALLPAKPSSAQEEGCFGTAQTSEQRLDLRFANGTRISVPYVGSHDITFIAEEGSDRHAILIYHPPWSMTKVLGNNLAQLYEEIIRQRVSWVRESPKNAADTTRAAIESIVFIELSDWQVTLNALNTQRVEQENMASAAME
jgi:hypothetical protein